MAKRRFFFGAAGTIGLFLLILDTKTAYAGACKGIALCIQTLIPSLFPFFIFSALLTSSFSGERIPFLASLGRLFQIPEGMEYLLIHSFLGGYPIGAQSVVAAYHQKQISQGQAQRLLAYCSNAGPAFLFGVLSQMFDSVKTIWILWGIQIGSAWLVSLFFPMDNSDDYGDITHMLPGSHLMQNAVKAMGVVCGWVILFRVIIQFLSRWFLWAIPRDIGITLIGLLELSNGCSQLALVENQDLRFCICSLLLSFGGICITMQTISLSNGLSIQNYIKGKLTQSVFSVLLSLALVKDSILILTVVPVVIIFAFVIKKYSRNPEGAIV